MTAPTTQAKALRRGVRNRGGMAQFAIWAQPRPPAFLLGQHTALTIVPSGTYVLAYPTNVNAGDLLVVASNAFTAGLTNSGITESGTASGNTWQQAVLFSSSIHGSTFGIWYTIAAKSGTLTVTSHWSDTSAGGAIYVSEWSGRAVLSGVSLDGLAQTAEGTAASITVPPLTTTSAPDLVLGFTSVATIGTAGPPWTLIDTNQGDVFFYMRDLPAGTYSPNTSTASGAYASVMVAFTSVALAQLPIIGQRSKVSPRSLYALSPRGRRSLVALPQINPPYPWPNQKKSGKSAMLRRGRLTNPVLTQTAVVGSTWPPPQLTARKRLLAALTRGKRTGTPAEQATPIRSSRRSVGVPPARPRARQPAVAQDMPMRVARTPGKLGGWRRGKRIEIVLPQVLVPSPVWPNRAPALARRLFALTPRGKRSLPTQPQIPVPPTIAGNRAPAGRRSIPGARGRQWSAASFVQPLVTLVWPPPKLGAAKRALVASTRGKRTGLPSEQPAVHVRRARRAPGIASMRARTSPRPAMQDSPPRVTRAPSRLGGLRRGKRSETVQPQVPVPPTIPGNRQPAGRRWAALRKGRRYDIPAIPPIIPLIWPPPKLGAARRLLSGAQRGRRVTPTPPQVPVPSPVWPNRQPAGRRLFALLGRGKRSTHPTGQASPPMRPGAARRPFTPTARGKQPPVSPASQTIAPKPVFPVRAPARRLLSRPGRSRGVSIVPAQITVPKPVWPNRAPALRRLIPSARGRRSVSFAIGRLFKGLAGLVSPMERSGSADPLEQTGRTAPLERSGQVSPTQRTPPVSPLERSGTTSPAERTGSASPTQRTGSTGPSEQTGRATPGQRAGSTGPSERTGRTSPTEDR